MSNLSLLIQKLERRYPSGEILLVFIFQLTFFIAVTLRLGASNGRDVDEILSVWAARLPSSSAVIDAIWKGVEFSPPTFDLIIHHWFGLVGDTLLTARLPSLVGILGASLIGAHIAFRRLGPAPAALVGALLLNAKWFDYALMTRPYGLGLLCTMLAVWFWDKASIKRFDVWTLGLGLSLFACGSLHFYSLLTFGALALMEALETLRTRRLRLPIWSAIFVAGAVVVLLFGSLAQHLARFSEIDATSSAFLGAPTYVSMLHLVYDLFLGSPSAFAVLLVALLALGFTALLPMPDKAETTAAPTGDNQDENRARVAIIGLSLLCIFPAGFLLALLHTHVFYARYALATCAGVAFLCALALSGHRWTRPICAILTFCLTLTTLTRGPADTLLRSALSLAAAPQASDGKPIVVGDGWLFMVMLDAAEPGLRSRLTYLTTPPDAKMEDFATENEIIRLTHIFPDLPILPAADFDASHPQFNLMCRPGVHADFACPYFVTKRPEPKVLALTSNYVFLKF